VDADPLIHLDTHVVAWLYDSPQARVPAVVFAALRDEVIRVSPMVRLELDYLHEIRRLTVTSTTILTSLSSTIGLIIDETPFPLVVEYAGGLSWTRDPFDRIIVAQALAAGARLATADEAIRARCPAAFWA